MGGMIWIPLSLDIPLLLFMGFAALVVHVCARLIDRVSVTIDPAERRTNIARTSICIGSMVWALDVVGLFLYGELPAAAARLIPALLALAIMTLSARLTVPALSTTTRRRRLVAAAAGLSAGLLAAHLVLLTSVGRWAGDIRWSILAISGVMATLIASGIAIRHRSAQLRALKERSHQIPWPLKVGAGVAILPLHFFMVNAFPLQLSPGPAGRGIPVLLVLVLFGVAILIDQMFNLQLEVKRQQWLNRALSMVRCVHSEGGDDAERRLAMIVERRLSLLSPGSMELHFQPICPVNSPRKGIRFEALLRVVDPELGPIHPEIFFLACERVGMAVWADRIILEQALQCSQSWVGPGCRGISVNLGPDTLLDPGFTEWLSGLLEQGNWPRGWLQLEITEHAMIATSSRLMSVLEELRTLGVKVVLDDFGAGFSSLTVLMDLPIQGIKCDRAFVKDLATADTRRTLLRHLLEIGEELRLTVTLEGVETETELAIARRMGIHQIQGNVFAEPMEARLVPDWLAETDPGLMPFEMSVMES